MKRILSIILFVSLLVSMLAPSSNIQNVEADRINPLTIFSLCVLSPENGTYIQDHVPLEFAVNETTSWIGYSLDGQANITIAGNTTMTDLTHGEHSVIVYANDTSGYMASSNEIKFFAHAYLGVGISHYAPSVTVYVDTPSTFPIGIVYSTGDVNIVVGNFEWIQEAGNTTISVTLPNPMIIPRGDQCEVWLTVNGTETGFYNGTVQGEAGPCNYSDRDIGGNPVGIGVPLRVRGITVANWPPTVVTIISPENASYLMETPVQLGFYVNNPTTWIGYSLDGQANVTINGNATLPMLSEGGHDVVVYANSTSGSMGKSARVFFSVFSETGPLTIVIASPAPSTYLYSQVPLEFAVNETTSWIGYSLDGQANVTIAGNTTITGLTYGEHYVTVYANNTSGYMGSSETISFTRARYGTGVSAYKPSVTVLVGIPSTFPVFQIINTGEVTMTYTCWWVQEAGNTTLPVVVTPEIVNLLPGETREICITVNATDVGFFNGTVGFDGHARDFPGGYCGGTGSVRGITVVDHTPPAIAIVSPQNITYASRSVPLAFAINEPISWIGYSLDSQSNKTITSNTIISVEDGGHEIVVYANDTFGNMGSSQIVCFTVDSSLYEPWETSFIGLGGYPIVGFTSYDGKLYAASNNNLYIYDGTGWNVLETRAYVTSLMSYESNLIIGGQGGLYSYDGSSFSLLFPVSTYIKVLGVYNNTLYAGTFLDKPPALYYCNGSPENPANWYVDTGFSTILDFAGAFGSIDSFAVYDGKMYVASGNTVYCFDGTGWSVALSYEYAYAFPDMQVYSGKLYLATRDLNRIPLYVGGTGFSGVIIEFDGENWTTVLGHDYWIYSLEVYDGKLYAGTANRIYAFNGTVWDVSFYSADGAYYATSMITYDGKIYAGMGNGYIFADPSPPKGEHETIIVPEFSSTTILAVFMALTMLAAASTRKNRNKRFG